MKPPSKENTVSLGTDYRNAYKADLNKPDEVEPPKDVDPATGDEVTPVEPTSAEEVSFKKRYGDLRRFLQQKEDGYKKNLATLQAQLDSATRQSIQLPKSEAELDAWAKEYPDVAKIVESIAMKKVAELRADVDKGFEEVKSLKRETAQERAEVELNRIHPDFNEIRNDAAFHAWVEVQPQWIQSALYDNTDDARAAARAIDLYKLDRGAVAPKRGPGRPRKEAGAAEEVRSSGRSSPAEDDGVVRIKESDVQRMTPRDFEKHEDAIMAARREGRFIYDVSGRAM
jgi:hypothetical protein